MMRLESPNRNVDRMPSSALTSLDPEESADRTLSACMLNPRVFNRSVGSSSVSSMVMTLTCRERLVSMLASSDVFPELLVPATMSVRFPSIMKLKSPAAKGSPPSCLDGASMCAPHAFSFQSLSFFEPAANCSCDCE